VLPYRIHTTFGITVTPWIISVATGMDIASQYENFMLAFAIDVPAVLSRLHLLPTAVNAPSGGLLPKPFEINEDWLPVKLQDHPNEAFQAIGPSLKDIQKHIINLPKHNKNPDLNQGDLYDEIKGVIHE
jgi:hypothetical protein